MSWYVFLSFLTFEVIMCITYGIVSPPKMSKRTGSASNYAYGRSKEKAVGRTIKAAVGGSYTRTPGSRGSYDVKSKTQEGQYILTQVKASRAESKSKPSVTGKDREKLVRDAVDMTHKTGEVVIANVARCKGKTMTAEVIAIAMP